MMSYISNENFVSFTQILHSNYMQKSILNNGTISIATCQPAFDITLIWNGRFDTYHVLIGVEKRLA